MMENGVQNGDSLESLKKLLEKHQQQHLLTFLDQLDPKQRTELLRDVAQVDFQDIDNFYHQFRESPAQEEGVKDEDLSPVPPEACGSVRDAEYPQYWDQGLRLISEGKVCVLLLAGGQGTRLGVDYPKGMFDVGLPSHKSLYHIQAERILKVQQLADAAFPNSQSKCVIPWYIMTSEHTKASTENYFSENDYFGLDKKNVVFFEQDMIPCLDFNGKILLDSKHKISRAPDGNGGLYNALVKHKVLDDMEARGIDHIHIYGVDNILVKMADPAFVGFCALKRAQCGNKVLPKAEPHEKVGVVCKVGDVYKVVEYSEISPATAELRDAAGKLVYDAGNIVNHYLSYQFLHHVCQRGNELLPYHIAKKKIPYVDLSSGDIVTPSQNSGIKREKFVFDIFPLAKDFAVFAVERDEEFSPLKNAESAADCNARTCRQDVYRLHASWLRKAGAELKPLSSHNGEPVIKQAKLEAEAEVCEVSPLVSYAGEGLHEICAGKAFTNPIVLK